MGKYININSQGKTLGTSFETKLFQLKADGAKEIKEPTDWKDGLVCLIDNGMFAAAGYAYSEDEMNEFKHYGNRPFQWLFYPNASVLAN